MGCAGWGGCAGSAGVGNITRTGVSRAAAEGALPVGSCSIEEAVIRPPPKPTARTANAVPTPAKTMRAFDDMVVYSRCQPMLESLLMFRLGKNRSGTNTYKSFVYSSDPCTHGGDCMSIIDCRSYLAAEHSLRTFRTNAQTCVQFGT
jgi:hypothetical protein